MSALVYAVAEIGVDHIIVAGHTNCGGVGVCVDAESEEKDECFAPVELGRVYGATEPRETSKWPPPSPLGLWLAPLRQLAVSTGLGPRDLGVANVKQQVDNISKSDVVLAAWAGTGKGKPDLAIHGWMYHLDKGLVRDLDCSIWGRNMA